MKRYSMLIVLLVFVSASVAAAADPLKVHEAGFGPLIRGLQLGKPMTWPEMLHMQANIIKNPKPWAPGTPPPIPLPVSFSIYIADNGKAVSRQDSSTEMPGQWILVNFLAGKALIMNGSGGILSDTPKSGTVDELFAFLKKNGLNYASTPNITLRDERIIHYSIGKDALPVNAATAAQFAQWVKNVCSLKTVKQKGEHYEASNQSEGWRMEVTDTTVTVFPTPIPD